MKKNILAPAVALSLGLTGSLGAIAAPAFADDNAEKTQTLKSADAGSEGDAQKPDGKEGDGQQSDGKEVYEPKVTLSNDKLTASEYSSGGVTITLEDGKPGNEYSFVVNKDDVRVEGAGGVKEADNKGAVSVKVVGKGDDLVGTYTVDVFDPAGQQRVAELVYTVTKDDDEQPGDDAPGKGPALNLSDKKITADDFVNDKKGFTATVSDLDPGTKVKFTVNGISGEARFRAPFEGTVTANKDGVAVFTPTNLDKASPDAHVGKYTVTAEFDGQTLEDSFEVVSGEGGSDDEAPAKDPALNLSEKKVKAVDFVNEEKGLKAVVSNLEPGTEVKFNVAGTSGNAKNVRPFKQTVKADKDGNAVFSIKGISEDNPSAYLGKYKVTAEFDGQKLEDSFEVVSGKGSGKSDSEEPGSGGGSVSGGASDNVAGSSDSGTLPRTGQGLGGLAAGVALLTGGGATVLLTRRTRKA
ncbi:Ig-like domain repeat protein [Brevibacterium ravenspurgense]|uniref:Ig-like domain repeat protein n=1 Tax=Brevibacterium ravenspurgense TaxID=479117 RepID=UPI0003090BF3|nr:Ig-like domain repeat protein [Brevibacterium ravenspurgense]